MLAKTPIRIAFCGRGGSGKTTLASEIARRTGLPLISESIRRAARTMGIQSLESLSASERVMLQTLGLQLQMECEALFAVSGFVSDRSRWDQVIYSKLLLPHTGGFNDRIERMAKKGVKYTHIFYVPPFTNKIEDDGFRFQNPRYLEVESQVDKAAAKLPKVIEITHKSVEGRVNEVLLHLGM